jgi:hypothetical protein
MAEVHGIEAGERREKAPVGLGRLLAGEIDAGS